MKIIIAGRNFKFVDNTKYFFIESLMSNEHRVSILVDGEKLAREINEIAGEGRALIVGTPEADEKIKEADWLVVDAFGEREGGKLVLGPRTRVCQLGHGVGLKAIGLLHQARTERSVNCYSGDDAFLVTSPSQEIIFSQMFDAKTLIRGNLPRNRVVAHGITSPLDTVGVDENGWELVQNREKFRILYAPTFRRARAGALSSQLDTVKEVCALCKAKNSVLFVKLHPEDTQFSGNALEQLKEEIQSGSVVFLDPLSDIYPLLREFDFLISDYSSIATDFLYVKKPIAIFTQDMDDYKKLENSYVMDPMVFSPGELCENTEKLLDYIKRVQDAGDMDGLRRSRLLNMHFSSSPETAVMDILEQLKQMGNDGLPPYRYVLNLPIFQEMPAVDPRALTERRGYPLIWKLLEERVDSRIISEILAEMRTLGELPLKAWGRKQLPLFLLTFFPFPVFFLRFYYKTVLRVSKFRKMIFKNG